MAEAILESIKTLTGKTFLVESCGSIGDELNATLYIEIVDHDIRKIVDIFSDEAENQTIILYDVEGKEKKSFVNFTSLEEAKVVYENKNIKIRLEKRISF